MVGGRQGSSNAAGARRRWSSSSLESSRESSGPPHLRSPERTDVESVAPLTSLFLTAPGAQDGLFLNGDSFVGRIVGQPDGSAGGRVDGGGDGDDACRSKGVSCQSM